MMRSCRSIPVSGRRICHLIYLVLFILMVFIYGCGNGQTTSENLSTGEGSTAFAINWHHTRHSQQNSQGNSSFKAAITDCVTEGIVDIQCNVFQESAILLTQGPRWQCASSARSGTIDGISAGENRTVVCVGLDGEDVIHLGRINNVTIIAGQITEADILDSYPFVTQIIAPSGGTIRANVIPFSWESIPNADFYHVQVHEEDDDFDDYEDLLIDDATITGSNYLPATLLPDETYFWRVAPMDRFGNEGRFSDPVSFHTEAGAVCRRPVFEEIGTRRVEAGRTLTFPVRVTDPDVAEFGDQLHFDNQLPQGARFNAANGTFTWMTSLTDQGDYTAIFSVCDSCETGELCDRLGVDIHVVAGGVPTCIEPEVRPIGDLTVMVEEPVNFTLHVTNAEDTHQLSYIEVNLPYGANFDRSSGRFSWTPPAGADDEYRLTFDICNSCPNNAVPSCVSEDVHLTVLPRPNGVCEPDSRRCTSNETPQVCNENGLWVSQPPCPYVCTGAGRCTGECNPGARRCISNDTPQLCNESGNWVEQSACPFICTGAGICSGECRPGAVSCSESTLRECDGEGQWRDVRECVWGCSEDGCSPPPNQPTVDRIDVENAPEELPSETKITCLVSPDSLDLSSTCNVIRWDEYTYWAFSYDDNRVAMNIAAYDSAGLLINSWNHSGARYLWRIDIDSQAQTFTFRGQGDDTIEVDWEDLWLGGDD